MQSAEVLGKCRGLSEVIVQVQIVRCKGSDVQRCKGVAEVTCGAEEVHVQV